MRSSRSLISRTSCSVAGAAPPPARRARSSVARATNELVIAAVITDRKASPISITAAATSCPTVLVGTTVAITHGGDCLDRPPEPLADRGEVPVIDDRHEQAGAESRDRRDRGDDRGTTAGRLCPREGAVEPALQAGLVLHIGSPFASPLAFPTRSRSTPWRSKGAYAGRAATNLSRQSGEVRRSAPSRWQLPTSGPRSRVQEGAGLRRRRRPRRRRSRAASGSGRRPGGTHSR